MYYKLKIGLIRAQELFIGGGRFSWGVEAFFSKIRNLGSSQSCLYGLTLADSLSNFSNFSSSGNARRQSAVLIEFSICSILSKYVI